MIQPQPPSEMKAFHDYTYFIMYYYSRRMQLGNDRVGNHSN